VYSFFLYESQDKRLKNKKHVVVCCKRFLKKNKNVKHATFYKAENRCKRTTNYLPALPKHENIRNYFSAEYQ